MKATPKELKQTIRIHILVVVILAFWFGPGLSEAGATPLFKCIPPDKASGFGGSVWNSFLTDGDGFNPVKITDEHGKLVYVNVFGSTHVAPDGEFIILCNADLLTKSFAAEYVQEKLKTLRVTDRKPRKNDLGITIGERIVGFLDVPADPHRRGADDPHTTFAVVIRTNGTNYSEICCRSLDDALAFEKDVEATNSRGGRK